jgi:EmrB/QacA subfamily drug resistance transporter
MKERTTGPWLILAITSLGVFMSALDITIVNVAFPDIRRTFPGTTPEALSWVLNGYTIAFGALLIASGRIADRMGRRRVFFGGLTVFMAGSLISGLAPTVPLLVGGRVLQGVGAALIIPASLGLLLQAFPAERRAFGVALWGSVSAIASAIGPTAGAAIVDGPGWRWAFLLNLPVGAVALLAGRRILREYRDQSSAGIPDPIGVALISAAMGALALGIVQGREWGWGDARISAAFAVSAVIIPLLIWRSRRQPVPVIELSLFRVRTFSVANVVMVFYATGFFSMLLGSVLYLTSVWHYSVLRAGLALTPTPLTVALVAVAAGRAAPRIGFRPLIATGTSLFAVGLAWMATQTGSEPHYASQWLPGGLMLGAGMGLSFALISAAAVSALPPTRFALGTGVNQTARQLGSIIGVAVLIAIVGSPESSAVAMDRLHTGFIFSAVMALGAGVSALALGGRPVAVAAKESPVAEAQNAAAA